MICPKCNNKMTLLLFSYVCDYCENPPQKTATAPAWMKAAETIPAWMKAAETIICYLNEDSLNSDGSYESSGIGWMYISPGKIGGKDKVPCTALKSKIIKWHDERGTLHPCFEKGTIFTSIGAPGV